MAANGESNIDRHSCKLCELSGPFDTNEDPKEDPIVNIVKAADVELFPWPWHDTKIQMISAKDLNFGHLRDQLDDHWHSKEFIDLKEDEEGKVKAQDAESAMRADKGEDDASQAVR